MHCLRKKKCLTIFNMPKHFITRHVYYYYNNFTLSIPFKKHVLGIICKLYIDTRVRKQKSPPLFFYVFTKKNKQCINLFTVNLNNFFSYIPIFVNYIFSFSSFLFFFDETSFIINYTITFVFNFENVIISFYNNWNFTVLYKEKCIIYHFQHKQQRRDFLSILLSMFVHLIVFPSYVEVLTLKFLFFFSWQLILVVCVPNIFFLHLVLILFHPTWDLHLFSFLER